jgi:hypothetical protein
MSNEKYLDQMESKFYQRESLKAGPRITNELLDIGLKSHDPIAAIGLFDAFVILMTANGVSPDDIREFVGSKDVNARISLIAAVSNGDRFAADILAKGLGMDRQSEQQGRSAGGPAILQLLAQMSAAQSRQDLTPAGLGALIGGTIPLGAGLRPQPLRSTAHAPTCQPDGDGGATFAETLDRDAYETNVE